MIIARFKAKLPVTDLMLDISLHECTENPKDYVELRWLPGKKFEFFRGQIFLISRNVVVLSEQRPGCRMGNGKFFLYGPGTDPSLDHDPVYLFASVTGIPGAEMFSEIRRSLEEYTIQTRRLP